MQSPSWVLGYHGCDRAVGEEVLAGRAHLTSSINDYDWLGSGMYFWEQNAPRALAWAKSVSADPRLSRSKISSPFVVGAIIDLGNCLNLLESESIRLVSEAHKELTRITSLIGVDLPKNAGPFPDRAIRKLDCAVINYLHATREAGNEVAFDTVRAAFVEGDPLYPSAGFHANTHI